MGSARRHRETLEYTKKRRGGNIKEDKKKKQRKTRVENQN
jgi:hypothetical protein